MRGVDVDIPEEQPKYTRYVPEKGRHFNKHVVFSNAAFLLVSGVCLIVAWYLMRTFSDFDQSGALEKFMIGKAVNTIGALFILLGVEQYVDTYTKGAYYRAILHSPIACAIWGASRFIVGGLVWINYQ